MAYDVTLSIHGPLEDLARLAAGELARHHFSFDRIIPTPAELVFELNNFVEDGYDALFGDWRKVAGRRMLQEPATQLGYPFPLQSREQLVRSLEALGQFGIERLELGRRVHTNIERFGFGHQDAWRKKHWACEYDVEEVAIDIGAESIRMGFVLEVMPPRKIIAAFSKTYPRLEIQLACIDEKGTRGQSLHYRNGKETQQEASVSELSEMVWGLRRSFAFAALAQKTGNTAWMEQVETNTRGHLFLQGVDIALSFFDRGLAAGKTIAQLAAGVPQITPAHIEALEAIRHHAIAPQRQG